MPNLPLIPFIPKSRTAWRTWLEKNHIRKEGIWLISYKKATGKARVDYDESVEEALCFGWIDSKGNKLDEERTMLWFAPRRAGTGWSKLNKDRVAKLLKAGLMAPAGMAKVERREERQILERAGCRGGAGDPVRFGRGSFEKRKGPRVF